MRQWKISASDYSERALWDDYQGAYEAMLEKCSTQQAPWYILPSNHKWFRNLAASQIIAATLQELHLQLPRPSVDIEAIRAQYHASSVAPAQPEQAAKQASQTSKHNSAQ